MFLLSTNGWIELRDNPEDKETTMFVRASLVNIMEIKERKVKFVKVRLYLNNQEVEGWIPEELID